MKLNLHQSGEYDARDFLEEETWVRWKIIYDECMAFRKSLKGKPTDEERLQLQANADWIAFCDHVLWHSARLANSNKCCCSKCTQTRQGK